MKGLLRGCLLSLCVFIGQIGLAIDAKGADIRGIASVIDGDTLDIHGQRIRLFGIDAPESAQLCENTAGKQWRCGQRAALALSDHIGRSTISCAQKGRDRYGRIVAVCSKGDEDLNSWMVTHGWALAYRHYSKDYVHEEATAKGSSAGIWSGQFIEPWAWRQGERLAAENKSGNNPRNSASGNTNCVIKGNISQRGERIYHVPGGQYYTRTRIDTSKGERWFCSEAEARAAGWRRSKR
jgi:endonuclease YncB( thermonuclease family)